jgi:hypothetical protein
MKNTRIVSIALACLISAQAFAISDEYDTQEYDNNNKTYSMNYNKMEKPNWAADSLIALKKMKKACFDDWMKFKKAKHNKMTDMIVKHEDACIEEEIQCLDQLKNISTHAELESALAKSYSRSHKLMENHKNEWRKFHEEQRKEMDELMRKHDNNYAQFESKYVATK